MRAREVESGCRKHSDLHHALVHEAGHAVAAIEFGIPFRAVVLYDEASMPLFYGGTAHALAAVEMCSDDSTTWVQPDVVGSLRFIRAGAAAEQAILGDRLSCGSTMDFQLWRQGTGTPNEEMMVYDEIVGGSFRGVVKEVDAWALQNPEPIVALANHLARHDAPFEMLSADVEMFLHDL